MKTWACGHCGHRLTFRDVHDGYTGDNECSCGHKMHVLDGVIRGGGAMAIWRDGREVWSGSGLEAVELLAKYLQPSCTIDAKRAQLAIDTIEGYGKFTPGQDGYAGIMVLRDYIEKTSSVVSSEQAAEADRIVREFSAFEGDGVAFLRFVIGLRAEACDYVAKYPKA